MTTLIHKTRTDRSGNPLIHVAANDIEVTSYLMNGWQKHVEVAAPVEVKAFVAVEPVAEIEPETEPVVVSVEPVAVVEPQPEKRKYDKKK
jgi:hypothetical protein